MKGAIVGTIAIMILIIAFVVLSIERSPRFSTTVMTFSESTIKISSQAFADQGFIPPLYTCEGSPPAGGINPPLTIEGVPAGTQSLILFMEDPDAPVGIWDHWLIFNMDPATTTISEGKEPPGIHGKGSGGNLTYKGPCPPSGVHRYLFTVYALDTTLDLPEGSSKLEIVNAMNGHVLDHAQLVGKYQKVGAPR